MCLTMYLGTDEPQSVISWDRKRPGLNVSQIGRVPKWLRQAIPQRFVYQIGAETGCGCGFLHDDDEPGGHAAMASLATYLSRVATSGAVELLICWMGDEAKGADTLSISPVEIEDLDLGSTWDRPLRLSLCAN